MNRDKSLFFGSKVFSRKFFYAAFAIIFFLSFQSVKGQNAPQIAALELGAPVEDEIAAKEKRVYQITLAENQFAFITVEQRGIDVAVRVFNPTEERAVAQKDLVANTDGREEIGFVASTAGVYRLEIAAKILPAVTGRYIVRLAEVRLPTAKELHLEEARKLHNESIVLWEAGKYAEATSVVERALAIREKESGAEDLDVAVSVAHLGLIISSIGDYEKSIGLYQRSLRIREKILGPDHLELAAPLTNLGVLYRISGDFVNAEQTLRRALEIREKMLPPNNPAMAMSFASLGSLLLDKGDIDKGLELYQRALSVWEKSAGPDHPSTASALIGIGDAYSEKGDYQLAEANYLRALPIIEKNFGAEHLRTANLLGSLGILYILQEDYAKAEPILRRTLAILEKAVGKEHRNYALALTQLAAIYTNTGEYQKAEPLYREAITIDEKLFGSQHPSLIHDLRGLARNCQAKGDFAQALDILMRTHKISEQNTQSVLFSDSERQKLLSLKYSFGETNQFISAHLEFARDNPAALDLALTTIFETKGRVADAMASDFAALRRHAGKDDLILLDKLQDTNNQLARKILDESPSDEPAEYQKQIKDLEAQKEKLEIEISRRSSEFRSQIQPVTIASIRSAIPDNAALIEFSIYYPYNPKAVDSKAYGEPRYVAYVVRKEGAIKWKDLGAIKPVDDAIEKFRQALSDPKRSDVQTLARTLDEKVMQPIRSLAGGAEHYLISPDGELNLIPFEALSDENNRYLVENYSFSYLTGGRDLLRLQTARESKNKSLIVANPSFGEPLAELTAKVDARGKTKRPGVTATRNLSDTYFTPLGGTLQEARSIQTIFPDALTLTDSQATETALKQVVAPRILHIATHGFFLEDAALQSPSATRSVSVKSAFENPLLRSGLALAGANRRDGNAKDDGILTALEASGLNLWGTKLVVLSACDTGLGDVKNGEGVYGLRRAFVLAGTESLVMSLWAVSDSVTRELMTNYYKNLKSGAGRGAALREVQLQMLKSKNRQHPFYWAAFIQSGEWANLDGKR